MNQEQNFFEHSIKFAGNNLKVQSVVVYTTTFAEVNLLNTTTNE